MESVNQFTSRLSKLPNLLSTAGLLGAVALQRRHLQLISIQGESFCAEVDTDAVKCTISRRTAEGLPGLHLDLTEGQRNVFQLLNGKECWSIGKAKASCKLTRDGKTFDFVYTFHIFEEHYVPVSLGRELLQQIAPELFPMNGTTGFDDHSQFTMDVRISGVPLVALPDSGSDVNVISRDVAEQFGWNGPEVDDEEATTLRGLSDAAVTPIGQVAFEWTFPDSLIGQFKAPFHVVPDKLQGCHMIIGRKLLDRSGILTTHGSGLKRLVRDIGEESFRVYGLRSASSLSTQRLQCQINGHHVLVSADTSAPVPLINPEDALQLFSHPNEIQKEKETIRLADNSLAQLTQSFHARLTVGTKTVQTRFYTLAGMKVPALSADVLFELDVFRAHAKSFIEVENADVPYDLKGGQWIRRTENKLLGFVKQGPAHVQVLPTIYELVPTDPEFLGKLRLVTAKEDQRRISALETISSRTGGWRQAAEDAERMAVDGFEAEKTRKRAAFERL